MYINLSALAGLLLIANSINAATIVPIRRGNRNALSGTFIHVTGKKRVLGYMDHPV